MSAFKDGGRRYRASRGQLWDDERDDLATKTGIQRGRLRLRATRGDQAARQALANWSKSQAEDNPDE